MRCKVLVRRVVVDSRATTFGCMDVVYAEEERGKEDEWQENGDDASDGREAGNGG